jgi:hypothetical protein
VSRFKRSVVDNRRNKTEGENAEAGQDEEADALFSATQVDLLYECGFQASSAQTQRFAITDSAPVIFD